MEPVLIPGAITYGTGTYQQIICQTDVVAAAGIAQTSATACAADTTAIN